MTKAADSSQHIERMLRLFWTQGYDHTSMDDVVTLLGLNRFTLYKSFGDKRHLLTLTLDRYREHTLAPALQQLSEVQRGVGAIEGYLLEMVALARPDEHALGCFLVNTALERAARDAQVEHVARCHLARVERGLADALRADQLTRDWSGEEVERHCRTLALAAQGLMVQARLGQSRADLCRAVGSLVRLGVGSDPALAPPGSRSFAGPRHA